VGVGYPISAASLGAGTLGNPIARAVSLSTTGTIDAYFILDATGQVWRSTSPGGTWSFLSTSNSTTGSSNQDGIAYWHGYLFKFRNNAIDYLAGGTGTWVTGWNPATGSTTGSATIQGGVKHFAYVATDDALYFTNGTGLGSIISENPITGLATTFDPTDTTKYTFVATPTTADPALQLPKYESAQSISEAGNNIYIGGSFNAIYPWSGTGIDFTYPIFVGDNFIKNLVQVNNNIYIFTGGNTNGRGRIYITNGSQASLFMKIPDTIIFNAGNYIDPYYEWGDAIYHRNNLIFGFFVAQNSGSGLINSSEVWAIDLDTKALRSVTSLSGSTNTINASVLIPIVGTASKGMGFIVGTNDNSTGPTISYTNTTAGFGTALVNTEYIPVGTFSQKKTFAQLEYVLSSPLQTGESILFRAQTDNDAQNLGTATPTSPSGSSSGGFFPILVEGEQWIQIQMTITGNNAAGVRLKELRLR